jgi:ribosome biogenesis GTPase A
MILCGKLRERYPSLLCARYKIDSLPSFDEMDNYELLKLIGKKRGFCISGGEIDTERTANMLLDEFRAGKIGRISLDALDLISKE